MEATGAINISSLIVGAQPAMLDRVRAGLGAMPGVEVHACSDDGRMIVSLETNSERSTVDTFEAIRQLDGVLSASLVYHQYETDPDEEA